MTILFVTEIAPIPPNGGEKIRSYGLLRLMSDLNYEVHAITGGNIEKFNISNVYPYSFDFKDLQESKRFKRLFKLWPPLIDHISNVLQQVNVDIAFIDYKFYGQYIDYFKKAHIPVIYGTHNAQAELFKQIPTHGLRATLSKIRHYFALKLHEYVYFRNADAVIVVSEDDKKYHQSFINNEIYVIPNFLDENLYSPETKLKENYIIMSANFKAYQNMYGLEWFISKVWNNQLWNKSNLLLVGLDSINALEHLKKTYECTNITAVGEVGNIKPYIAKAKVAIVPLLHGSGTRLKCLEAMALRTQLVSTTKGAEGIEHESSIIIADTEDQFRKSLIDVLESQVDFSDLAYEVFLRKYSINANKAIFEQVVNSLTRK